jgi:hypothetical protein
MFNNPQEARDAIINGFQYLNRNSQASDDLLNWLYNPPTILTDLLDELKIFLELSNPTRDQRQDAGYLLERILVCAFSGLAGFSNLKSYNSSSHQIDLLITGDNEMWDITCDRLYLRGIPNSPNYRGILIEAKAIQNRVSCSQFSRLCCLLNLDFSNSLVGLGVFFTLNGATGFPKRNTQRSSCIKNARLLQIIYSAKTGKKIIVLDKDDVLELDKPGSLIRILIRKIREVEELTNVETSSAINITEVILPEHLSGTI